MNRKSCIIFLQLFTICFFFHYTEQIVDQVLHILENMGGKDSKYVLSKFINTVDSYGMIPSSVGLPLLIKVSMISN